MTLARTAAALVGPLVVGLLVGSLATSEAGCASSGSSLARDDGGAAPGGATTTSSSSTGGNAGNGGSGAVGGSGGDLEPPGPARLSVVNGTVDADEIRLCFVPYPPDGPTAEAYSPWPATSALGYARAAVVDPTGGALPEGSDVEVIALTGALEPTYGLDCGAILDGPPAGEPVPWPLSSSLGVLPASALLTERSLLLVTVGCVGGEDHTDMVEALACGADYTPTLPTAGLVAAPMSRFTVDNRVSMQFVQGSVAMPVMDVRVRAGNEAAATVYAVNNWSLGAIAPYPPLASYSVTSLGVVADAVLELYTSNSQTAEHVATFAEIFEPSSLSLAELADGDNLVFVAVGSMPGLSPGAWWHELRYAVVAADPP